MEKREIRNLKEMEILASEILKSPKLGGQATEFGGATVLALKGDLGVGKTAFVKSLGKILGVKETINSPTFVIMKMYDISYKYKLLKKLIHIDAYRLEEEKELEILGWENLIKNPENLIAIEWPEKVSNLIPENAHIFKFEFVDENTRSVTL